VFFVGYVLIVGMVWLWLSYEEGMVKVAVCMLDVWLVL
jgi:hypothetical protein